MNEIGSYCPNMEDNRLLRGPFLKTFQQPLAKKDEDYYLERLGNEDEEEKQEAKQILIERNLRLVAHIAKKYQGTEVDMEDLISIGTVGLIKAVMSYDLDKNSKLGTYAARCIENVILSPARFGLKTLVQKQISSVNGEYFPAIQGAITLCVKAKMEL